MTVICCICEHGHEVPPDTRDLVCEKCLTPLIVYEDGSTEPM